MESRIAPCCCGQLRIEVYGEHQGVGHRLAYPRRTGSVAAALAGFNDPHFPAPTVSIYDCRRHPWVALPTCVVVFGKDPA
jgi:hypothetical protein